MKIRLKFIKQGQVKFVGHLDIIRMFQRAIKIARIPIAYSQGFNPHSLVYFAMPLSVGVDSVGEYMDIVTSTDIDPVKVREMLNNVLTEGIQIIDGFVVEEDNTSLMSLVDAAEYEIVISRANFDSLCVQDIRNKLSGEELITEKKGKKGIKPVNIKPLIVEYSIDEAEKDITIHLKVLAGSSENLSPNLFLKAVLDKCTLEDKCISITRKELYTDYNHTYTALDKYRRK
jgi:radical SAM-linked protein